MWLVACVDRDVAGFGSVGGIWHGMLVWLCQAESGDLGFIVEAVVLSHIQGSEVVRSHDEDSNAVQQLLASSGDSHEDSRI